MSFLPINQMQERLSRDRSESDVAVFLSLMYFGEMMVKTSVAALVSALSDDPERQRYGFLYRLVRADGIGEWTACLRELCTGPAFHLLDTDAREERRELTQNVSSDNWQHEAAVLIHECTSAVAPEHPELARKASLLHWFEDFAILRNKTRGHGAQRVGELGGLCEDLQTSINLIADNFRLFKREWAFLHRNLSGKYRVTPLGGSALAFDELKKRRDVSLPNGVYVVFSGRRYVDLIHADPDAADFLYPNGSFSSKSFELLSYSTGSTFKADSRPYLEPCGQLPTSETEGASELGVVGSILTNLPDKPPGYVRRSELESDLRRQLLLEHHPIVTLSGYGGIGKTSLALRVIHDIARDPGCPYSLCVWFSSRDIDLLLDGAKRVRPGGVSLKEFARVYAELVAGPEAAAKGFDAVAYMSEQLADPGSLGRILFVFDNFETVESPGEVFDWIDTHVRSPNKVLVTTRIRGEFQADYPLQVLGMTEDESMQLIHRTARFLGVDELLERDWCEKLIEESSGHPYVMKILLGEVAKSRRLGKPRRLVATRERMLDALFERTYESLSPAAQRVLLTLANWNSGLPEIGLEAVLLRNLEERSDVQAAIDELVQSSLLLRTNSADGNAFLELPLAALMFAKRRLEVSPWRASVEVDSNLLKDFGASRGAKDEQKVEPRITRFFRQVAERASEDPKYLDKIAPVLEYIATGFPQGWLLLADLYEETNVDGDKSVKEYLRRYLESPADERQISWTWQRLANVCHRTNDLIGEIHALAEMSQSEGLPLYVVSNAANRVNARLSEVGSSGRASIGNEERRVLLLQLASSLEAREKEMSATDFSRLGWLYVSSGDTARAMGAAGRGLAIDATNEYCQRLHRRLHGQRY